ncbi:hypothetical protein [Dyella acidiphila]|uniref:Uncharacterized protein n=1 Tax=Dyella acidiphila TaxID=2775866 RepID=A0ABR9GFF5_9GAMM|nr:hypothetical protein [Dyella acidiphila]MBE1162776.1 hypothetical protein [Dyella acidiphila]
MPYIIQQATGTNPPLVSECCWGEAVEVNFGAMTSCIALVQQSADAASSIRVIHLALISEDGTPVFDPDSNVLGQIGDIMGLQGDLRACIGCIDFWQASSSVEVQEFFYALIEQLQIGTLLQLPDGPLRARWGNDTIQYALQGSGWVDIPY